LGVPGRVLVDNGDISEAMAPLEEAATLLQDAGDEYRIARSRTLIRLTTAYQNFDQPEDVDRVLEQLVALELKPNEAL